MQNITKKKREFLFNGRFSVLICLILCFSCDKNPQSKFGLKTDESTNLPILDIPNKPQESTNWCWAASLQMVILYLNKQEISQCEIVTKKAFLENPSLDLSLTACNLKRSVDKCTYVRDSTSEEQKVFFKSLPQLYYEGKSVHSNLCGIDPKLNIDAIKNLLKIYNLEGIGIEKNENTLQNIKSYINKKNPIIAFYASGDLAIHIVVVNGYQEINGHTYLLINNPLFNKTASCEGCRHLIQTDSKGDNELSNQEDSLEKDNRPKNGTYCALAYLAIVKSQSATTN